ncbi:MAG: TetR/AcrR family transcriptional regulator [Nocardioides sp.]|jgi:AcrR family transcriptional regulator|uniref:TetR/AcrR family transcriptional regulator n=1 Tax=Nocardioides sp. TaxID=35761 RepID=UPI0026204CC3|nr:TetR/AcrR family transcriptional regulator [Nocardioides sp.]MCW2834267.1 TetR/AcrR family transcriptional regulator [Nocardioides sp.]
MTATAYHHGDLRAALVEAAIELARPAGAESIVLREVTRRAGVTPRAAYRHFADRDDLVRAVAQRALAQLATAIERRMADTLEPDGRAKLQAVGESYIAFALDEPGLFDVAFFAMDDMLNTTAPESTSCGTGLSPYQLLEAALEALVAEGGLSSADVGDAVITCWSGVHGFATLTARGPLRELPRQLVDEQSARLVTALVDAVDGRTRTG